MNVNLNERNWDRNYFSHVTHALYVLEIIMDVHEIENQIIKEFDRFISIFSINLEFFVVVDLNVFRHCSIEVNRDKEKPSRFFGQCKRSVYRPVAGTTALFKCYAFCSLCRKLELFLKDSVDFVIRYTQCIKRRLNFY